MSDKQEDKAYLVAEFKLPPCLASLPESDHPQINELMTAVLTQGKKHALFAVLHALEAAHRDHGIELKFESEVNLPDVPEIVRAVVSHLLEIRDPKKCSPQPSSKGRSN